MNKILWSEAIPMVVLGLLLSSGSIAQVQTPRYVTTSANSHGFYEYLPQGYSSGATSYPLLLAFHGMGDIGNGVSELPRVLNIGLPKLIADGRFPASFVSGGSTYRFIVISPQFVYTPVPADIDALLEYVIRNYRVDRNRIYLTGLSMGGGAVWNYTGHNSAYARKIAAIVPICGALYPDRGRAQIIAGANVPVWATHNQGDRTVPVSYTNDFVNFINSSNPPPSPPAKKTIFLTVDPGINDHDAWTKTYDPSFTENGMNMYQYLLQFQRNVVALPVVLGDYKAHLNGNAGVAVKWNTTSEINNRNFLLEKSADGINFSVIADIAATNNTSGYNYSVTDHKPLPGNNFYRLAQIDIDGKTTYFDVLKVVVPVSGSQQFFRLSPNPVINTVMLEIASPGTGPLQVSLADIQGNRIKLWHFAKANPIWQQNLDITGIPDGNYIITVRGDNVNEVQRFIKQ